MKRKEGRQRPEPRAETKVESGGVAPDIADLMDDWFFGSSRGRGDGSAAAGGDGGGLRAVRTGGGGGGGAKGVINGAVRAGEIAAVSSPRLDGAVRREREPSPAMIERRDPLSRSARSEIAAGSSPRLEAAARQEREPSSAIIERRDPLSRSARRNSSAQGSIAAEVLSPSRPSSKLRRQESLSAAATDSPTAAAAQQWNLKPNVLRRTDSDDTAPPLPPKQPSPARRNSRFGQSPATAEAAGQPPLPPRRTFRSSSPSPAAAADRDGGISPLLSPPRDLVVSASQRSVSATTCSTHRRTASGGRRGVAPEDGGGDLQINSFLRRQRDLVTRASTGRSSPRAKIVLSGSPASRTTTSSMVAAICYAWLLDNRERMEGRVSSVAVPVINVRRERMHKHRQAAWLFHHLGIDASSLVFCDEIDLDDMKARQSIILVVGQDVPITENEVGSPCTAVIDNYCEEAYDLLKAPNVKKLLLAGILLDTHNLDNSASFHTHKDVEAVQLLLVGSSPTSRHELFENLMRDHTDISFLEALIDCYGYPPRDRNEGRRSFQEPRAVVKASSPSVIPAREIQSSTKLKKTMSHAMSQECAPTALPSMETAEIDGARKKNHQPFLARLFGFKPK